MLRSLVSIYCRPEDYKKILSEHSRDYPALKIS
jgi:hypothetical protein